MIGRRELIGAGAAMMLASRAWAKEADLDLALVGGTIWTSLPALPRTDALGVIGDRIVALGSDAVNLGIGRKTRVIKLGGAFVMPAFIDNHTHFLKGSLALIEPELLGATDQASFADRIGRAARARPGRWILGQSWDEQRMGGQLPTKAWVDAVTPDTPVAVPRTDLHMLLINSAALKLAGIDRNTPDPDGGVIVRDAAGDPTGILKDNAKALVERVIPRPAAADERSALAGGIALAHRHGIAQVHITEIDWNAQDALRRDKVAKDAGLRFYSMVPLQDWEKLAAIVGSEGRGDQWVRWGGLKGLADGSLGSRTALFKKPYDDAHDTSGVRIMPLDDMRAAVAGADRLGLQVTIHAIGDRANEEVLDVLRDVAASNGPRDRRFRIEHAQHVALATIPRFARQGVIASVQPYHAIDDGRWAAQRIGRDRLAGTYAFGSLIRSGAHVTFGSDWSVAPLDPILGIHAAVTRETTDGANPQGWIPEQKVSAEEAMVAYTSANAHAGFQETLTGTLAPCYLADIVVLDGDISRMDPERIQTCKVLRTFVGGIERYAA